MKPTKSPIDPNSPREQLRSCLQWLPAWLLLPLGLGPTDSSDSTNDGTNDGATNGAASPYEGGYGGPLDSPGHPVGGDHGGHDIGGGGLGGF